MANSWGMLDPGAPSRKFAQGEEDFKDSDPRDDLAKAKPSQYYSYDAEGNLSGRVEWNEGLNGFTYHEGNLTAEKKEQKAQRSKLLSQTLAKLSSPEQYEEYATAYRTEAQGYIDKQLGDQSRLVNEEMNRKGMTGSTAWTDERKNIMDTRKQAYMDIFNKSIMVKEDLKNNAFNRDSSLLNSLAGIENQDFNNSLNRQNLYVNAALGFSGAQKDIFHERNINTAFKGKMLTDAADTTVSGISSILGGGMKMGGGGGGGGKKTDGDATNIFA